MKKLLTLLIIGIAIQANAQVYTYKQTRHRFAQMNIGTDFRTFSSSGTSTYKRNGSNELEKSGIKGMSENRLIIGGTHFWGHADFYVAFPIAKMGQSDFSTSVETGFRYFPWRIENNKIRPYLGVSLLPVIYNQGSGADLLRMRYPLQTGIALNKGNHIINIGAGFNYNSEIDYYVDDATSVSVKLPKYWFSFGYKYMFETTISAEKSWESGRAKKVTEKLAKDGKLNGLTVAIGPSSAFFVAKSDYNQSELPYLDNHKASDIFIDFGLGYYWHNPDIQFNLAYRNINSEIVAFNSIQKTNRRSISAELYKFTLDFHGFVPFVGPSLNYEILEVSQSVNGVKEDKKWEGIRPGLTFGWDIRPNRIQGFILRTNLRWTPNLKVKMDSGKDVRMDQLEFNFIQLVLFPERLFR
jgi:hypothetical protein